MPFFDMGGLKAPGGDGFQAFFFIKANEKMLETHRTRW